MCTLVAVLADCFPMHLALPTACLPRRVAKQFPVTLELHPSLVHLTDTGPPAMVGATSTNSRQVDAEHCQQRKYNGKLAEIQ